LESLHTGPFQPSYVTVPFGKMRYTSTVNTNVDALKLNKNCITGEAIRYVRS